MHSISACGKHLSNGYLVTHQIWTQSGQPLWSYRGRGCLRHPLPGTCHVPWQAPVGIGTGQIRNLLNGDIEQRRPLVNRSTRSRDISFSKAWWGRVGLGRVGSGRAYWDFCLKPQKNSLRASRSARNKLEGILHFPVIFGQYYVRYEFLVIQNDYQTYIQFTHIRELVHYSRKPLIWQRTASRSV